MAIVPMTDAVSGGVASASEYNKLIDNIEDLDGRTSTLESYGGFGAWTAISLATNIQARAGYYPPRVRTSPGNMVDLYGALITSDGTGVANGIIIATLPVGYRPSSEVTLPCATNRGYTVSIHIATNGDVSISHLLSNDPSAFYFGNSFPLFM